MKFFRRLTHHKDCVEWPISVQVAGAEIDGIITRTESPSGAMAELRPFQPKWSRYWALAILLLPPLVYLGLATVRLDAQGLYYDELHQATGAFTYLGRPPWWFSRYPIHGLPLFNMTYSGALKTAIYGLYLRFVNPEFSVLSWRMVGICFVAAGLVIFTLLSKRTISPLPLLVILGLILTDTNLLLCTRHDYGPVALGFTLRLMLIGVWLRSEAVECPSPWSSFALGGLTGIAVFEKLSSLVLVLTLGWVLLFGKRRTTRHWLAAAGGVCLGALPVIFVNLESLVTRHELFFQSHILVPNLSWGAFLNYVWAYLGLGAGREVQYFILGRLVSPAMLGRLEPWLLLAALAFAVIYAGAHSYQRTAQLTLVAAGCYVIICVGIFLLPQNTGVHHWVIGTPFQYVAIGLALETLISTPPLSKKSRLLGLTTPFIAGILLVTRLVSLAFLEGALWRGQAGRQWSPDLTELGRLAAAHVNDSIFVAADWGVGTQILCFANGRPDFVYEPIWYYTGPEDLLRLQQGGKALYAVTQNPPRGLKAENTKRIFRDLEGSGYWQETPVEPEFSKLVAVTVRKFVPVSSGNVLRSQ
jgi:hypothetical protein